MKILKLALLSLLPLASSIALADSTAVSAPTNSDPLTEALPILQAKYIDFKTLNYKQGDHLSDLITRSEGKIDLITPEFDSNPIPILATVLPDHIIYWRLASFALPPGKNWPDLAAQLQPTGGVTLDVVLDLRSNAAPDDYSGAKQLLDLFASLSADRAPTIMVLTNNRTAGAAEALAGFLQADGALVVGRATAGHVAIFDEMKLSTGQILRYAVAPTATDDPAFLFKFRSHVPEWGRPVIPDLAVTVDDHTEKAALTLIKDNQISEVVEESPERHRLNEATLVKGQDPEYDEYLASLEEKPVLLSLPIIHDVVLIHALDSLKAIRLSERAFPAGLSANAPLPSSTSVQ
jgi:hypothetical protein